VGIYVDRISDFQPRFLHVYPSTATLLATLMLNNNLRLNYNPCSVLCGSEKLYPGQRELLQTVFNCRVYAWYGQSEYVALAGECEHSQYYHVFPEYGYVEFVETDRTYKHDGEEVYEIVATGFNNYALPFIRYQTRDYAVLTDHDECACGRNYPLIKDVIGRDQDYIITSDKRLMSLTGLIFGQHFDAFSRIERIQLVQDRVGEVEIRIVPCNTYRRQDEIDISSKIMECIGNRGLTLKFDYVSEIPVTSMGKHVFLKQNLDLRLI
jgi:phenylacetate-CoA ligase